MIGGIVDRHNQEGGREQCSLIPCVAGVSRFFMRSVNIASVDMSNSQDPPIQVLWEDPYVIAVLKPPGILTTRTGNHPSLEQRLLDSLPTCRDSSGPTSNNVVPLRNSKPFLRMPHRLDRCVSGVVLVAKSATSARLLSQQFAAGNVRKTYLALVAGRVRGDAATWTDYLAKVPDQPRGIVVDSGHLGAKRASLACQVLQRWGNQTLVRLELQTGRMHQIRIQAAHRGHPIHGDQQYGSTTRWPLTDGTDPNDAIALHANEITFRHPKTAVAITVSAAWPECPVEAMRLNGGLRNNESR